MFAHLHLHHVDGVPAPLDLLGAVPGLLDEDDAGKAVVQVPQVHGRHAALKVPATRTGREGGERRERGGGGGRQPLFIRVKTGHVVFSQLPLMTSVCVGGGGKGVKREGQREGVAGKGSGRM